jgi:AcrR family transcriptional regulator
MRPHKDGGQCDTRAAILNAAEQLLVEGNISSLTVRAIANRAGMTDMGVIHHFRSKDELIWSVIEHVGACLRAELSTLGVDWVRGGTGLDALVERLSDFYCFTGKCW